MGTLSLSALIEEVRGFCAGRADLTDEVVTRYLNLAQERIATIWDWEELGDLKEATLSSSGTAKSDKIITLPTNHKEIISFRLITSTGESSKLTYRSLRQFDKLIPEPEYYARGKPFIYTIFNGQAELYKVPDQNYSYSIRSYLWPAAFSTSDPGALSNLDKKDSPLIYLSTSMIMDRLGEYERATRLFGISKSMIDVSIDEEENRPDLEIKPSFEGGLQYRDRYWNDPFIKKAPI